MTVRSQIRVLLAALAACLLMGCTGEAGSSGPRNLVLIVADDLGWNDVGYHGSEIPTPHIDALADEGVALEHFYAFPLCSPTRAALLTGRSSFRHGIVYEAIKPHLDRGLPLSERLLSDYLLAAGYDTALVGKWHLGHAQRAQLPNARGFQHFYGSMMDAVRYEPKTRYKSVDWQRNGETVHDETYATRLLGTAAAEWIAARPTDRPFFLYLPFTAPHTPLEAPAETIAKLAHIEPEDRRIYAAMVSEMDTAIGQVLDALDATGRADDTLVVFISDNGGNVIQGGASNEPLQAGKRSIREGGVRVPAVLRMPGVLPAGAKSEQLAAVYDLLPTALAALGVEAEIENPLDGVDLWPALTTGNTRPRAPVVVGSELKGDILLHAAIGTQWKLREVEWRAEGRFERQLFRIRQDPTEQHDVAAQFPAEVERLAALIAKWKATYPENGLRLGAQPPADWQAPPDWAAAVGD